MIMPSTRLLVAISLAASVPRAFAGPADDAKPHVAHAMALYKDGKFLEALDELNVAYAFDPQPLLLYAIAQADVKLDRCPDAISFYQRFLDTKPPEGPAGAAREAIAHCHKLVAAQPKPVVVEPKPVVVEPKPVVVEPSPEPTDTGVATPAPWYANPIGDALVGGGVISGVVGILLYRAATSDLDQAESVKNYQASQSLVDSAHSKRTYGVVLGVGGLALVGAGVVYLVTHTHSKEPAVAVAPTTGGGVVTWGRSF